MVVKHCATKVVGCCNCVHITCEMKVDVLHRKNLCITAACGTAFNSEYRTKRRFTECDDCLFTDFSHCLTKTCRSGGFALACRCWVDCCYEDKLSVRIVLYTVCKFIRKFCFVLSVKLKLISRNPKLICNFCNRL